MSETGESSRFDGQSLTAKAWSPKFKNSEPSTQTFGSHSSRVSRKPREPRAHSEIHSADRRSRH